MNNDKYTRYVTPAGIAQYPYLNKPDTKFNPEGDYKVNMSFKDSEELQFIIKDLNKMLEDYYQVVLDNPKYAKIKNSIRKADFYYLDDDGTFVMKFKQRALIKSAKGNYEVKIPIFDSKGKPTKASIGGGSKIKVCFSAAPYYVPSTRTVGITLRPVAIQVIDLKVYDSHSAESYGFEEEEGYEADSLEEMEEDNPFEEASEDETSSKAGDF